MLDISGNIVVPRTQVGAINDVNALVEAGICSSDSNGSWAEGIKMKHDRLYIGFATHGPWPNASTAR